MSRALTGGQAIMELNGMQVGEPRRKSGPACQEVYFLCPFHHLYCDLLDYSLEDLASINDFRVDVKVTLQTRERDK